MVTFGEKIGERMEMTVFDFLKCVIMYRIVDILVDGFDPRFEDYLLLRRVGEVSASGTTVNYTRRRCTADQESNNAGTASDKGRHLTERYHDTIYGSVRCTEE